MPRKKLLVIDVAALGWNTASKLGGFFFQNAVSAFPAVTCTAQATFRTAAPPQSHGMVSNGLFFPELRKVLFWEQAAALVKGERIWEKFRKNGGKVGMMFWQQSLGESVDLGPLARAHPQAWRRHDPGVATVSRATSTPGS